MCARSLNLVVLLLCPSELDRSKSTWFLRESASSFIDEGDGLTSERKRVRVLLSLVVHAGGYRMMVGAHNIVECQMHVGGLCCLLRVWQTSAPATLLIPGGLQGVLPCSPGTVNVGATTLSMPRGMWGGLTVWE